MRGRITILAICATVLIACDSESTKPERYNLKSLVGVWEVVPDSTWDCWSGRPYLWFLVEPLDSYSSFGSLTVVSTWSRNPETVATGRSITGYFDARAQRASFRLWWSGSEVFAYLDGDLEGTMIRGILSAPKGMASAWTGCNSKATAKRL